MFNHMVNGEHLDATFAALADSTRRAILARLALGEASVGELASPFAISLPAVSKHLKVLEGAGLVARRVDGRVHRLSISAAPLHEAADFIDGYRRFWESQMDALARHLESDGGERTRRKRPRRRVRKKTARR